MACTCCAPGSAFDLEVHAQVNPDTTFNLPFPHDNGDMFNPPSFQAVFRCSGAISITAWCTTP